MIPLLLVVAALIPSIYGKAYYGVKVGSLHNDLHQFGGEVWLANETALLISNWNQRANAGSGGLYFYFSTDKARVKADQLCKAITAPGGDYCKPIEAHLNSESNGDIIAVMIPGGYKKWKRFAVVANDDKVEVLAIPILYKANPPATKLWDSELQQIGGTASNAYVWDPENRKPLNETLLDFRRPNS